MEEERDDLVRLENDIDSEDEFEANYKLETEDEDLNNNANDPVVQYAMQTFIYNDNFGIPSSMRALNLEAMQGPEFPKHANIGVMALEDGEFVIGIDFQSRESVILEYTITREVDYMVWESELLTFYAKCKQYDNGCDCLIRASLIRRKGCWEIRRYNGRHTCTVGVISQNHSKLDFVTIADVMRLLVEAYPSL